MSAVPAQVAYETATISSGSSLSASVFLGGRVLCGVYMPGTWTAASLTFQASHDGTTFVNVYTLNDGGTEFNPSAAASIFIPLDAAVFAGARHVKVRSGTSGAAVNQGADRDIVLALWEFAG